MTCSAAPWTFACADSDQLEAAMEPAERGRWASLAYGTVEALARGARWFVELIAAPTVSAATWARTLFAWFASQLTGLAAHGTRGPPPLRRPSALRLPILSVEAAASLRLSCLRTSIQSNAP